MPVSVRVDVEAHALADGVHEGVEEVERGRRRRRRDLAGEGRGCAASAAVSARLAEEDAGREALDLAADARRAMSCVSTSPSAVIVRPSSGPSTVKEWTRLPNGSVDGCEAAVAVDVDAPVDDELAVVAARRQAEHLDRAARRRGVAVGGLVEDAEAHRAALRRDTAR